MGPKRFLQEKLAGFAGALGQIAGSVGEVVSSAGELLADADLRRKGAKYIVQEASRGINEAQKGLEAGADALGRTLQQGAKAQFGAGARQLQAVLRNIERQVQDFQRQQQQHDLQSELEHHHKLPVDIQIGDQVFEEMPQEMRSRFWYVLLERPDLAQQLMKHSISRANTPGPGEQQPTSRSNGTAPTTGDSSSSSDSTNSNHEQQQQQVDHQLQHTGTTSAQVASPAPDGADPSAGSPFAAYSRSPDPIDGPADGAVGQLVPGQQATSSSSNRAGDQQAGTAAAAAAEAGFSGAPGSLQVVATGGSVPDIDDLLLQPSSSSAVTRTGSDCTAAGAAAAADNAAQSAAPSAAAATAAAGVSSQEAEAAAAAVLPKAPCPWVSGHSVTSIDPPVSVAADPFPCESSPLAPSPWQDSAAAAGQGLPGAAAVIAATEPAATAAASESDSATATPMLEAVAAASEGGEAVVAAAGPAAADGEGWELVSRDVPAAKAGSTGNLEALDTVRTLVESMSEEAALDAQRSARQTVFLAMLEVPWVAGEGIPDSPLDGTEYAELLAAGCGSVEEVILRDVPRTFPEHPLFNTPAGQQRLLRVLKAYAAADPEVGYCQGMAFAAGVLLMYLPEEPAFRLFKRIMSPGGPNLRRYYLPGLDHLKLELSCFELLLSSHQPQLHQHLLDAGLPALLYAAQWLMTTYSCPFPMHVAARVLDVLLQSDSDAMLPRLGLAVMEALSSKLLELDDFEQLITYLKVKPLSWPLHVHRKVFAAALQNSATDAELQAAMTASHEEFARSGRMASFSNRHLRSATSGGTTRHELAPGPMGPRPLAAAEAAAEGVASQAAGNVEASDMHTSPGSGSSDMAADGSSSSSRPQDSGHDGRGSKHGSCDGSSQQRQLSGRPSSIHDAVLVGPASSGLVVDELDALEDLITDLDLLLPGGVSETDSDMASPEPVAPPPQHRPQPGSDGSNGAGA